MSILNAVEVPLNWGGPQVWTCVTKVWSRVSFASSGKCSRKVFETTLCVFSVVRIISEPVIVLFFFFYSSLSDISANLCYQVHWPAVCHRSVALNKMSPRLWRTSVFSWIRTQQHNLLLPIPVSVSLFKSRIAVGGGAVCVSVCVCAWEGRSTSSSSLFSAMASCCVIGHLHSASWMLCAS